MKLNKLLLFSQVSLLLLVTACVSTPPLYVWNDYSTTSYNYIKNTNEETEAKLLATYENLINGKKGSRELPPPGICADYAFLLMKKGKMDEAKKMLAMEMTNYPESSVYVQNVLKKIEENEKSN